ncbi:DNA-binding XRE family transcriptional regulator [Neobacillus drentensis]|nr:DNA-binding XRE family transcriptional regulator [Neobacillus drentensis]
MNKKKPTVHWIEDDSDSEYFTEDYINAINEILDVYINTLEKLDNKPTNIKIMNAVNKAVSRINELNEKYDYYIEKSKREELYEFIYTAAQTAGLKKTTIKKIKKKKDKVNLAMGMAVSFGILVLVGLVTKLFSSFYVLSWGMLAGIMVVIGLSIYFFIQGKPKTSIGLILSYFIVIFFFVLFFYALIIHGYIPL